MINGDQQEADLLNIFYMHTQNMQPRMFSKQQQLSNQVTTKWINYIS